MPVAHITTKKIPCVAELMLLGTGCGILES